MELAFIIIGSFLFVSWLGGALLNFSNIRKWILGDESYKYRAKKTLYCKRIKKVRLHSVCRTCNRFTA